MQRSSHLGRLGAAAVACALALFASVTAAAAQTVAAPGAIDEPPAPERRTSASPAPRYFIEFRSRTAVSYGHTFVVHGRVGERLTANNVAGLHPRGDSSVTYIIGHVLPVPADTGASDGDLDEQYLTARYRILLSAAQYRAVVDHIRHLQANSPVWNAMTYNCNAFVGTIAHFVGLTSPPPWLLPEDFVNGLRVMNDGQRYAAVPGSSTPRRAVRETVWGSGRQGAAGRAMARHIPNVR